MKAIHLNLASRPYRDYRPVYAVVVAVSLVTAFLMLNNVETFYRYINETRATRSKIEALEAQAQRETESRRVLEHRLRGLDLATLDTRTRFINENLEQRAFSWSTLLDELESVLPDDVRLLTIAPSFENGSILLSLQLQSRSAEGMIETINRMHADPQFSEPFPSSEVRSGDQYDFNLRVSYLPPGAVIREARR